VHCLTAVSVDLISTSTMRDIGPGLAATMYLMGNRCSQAGWLLCWFGIGDGSGFAQLLYYLQHIYEVLLGIYL
jgi:cystathionine beta-lyase family protein involved in aluminum resistance